MFQKLLNCNDNISKPILKVALIYPNSSFIAYSNLGFQRIYELLCKYGNIFIERIFFENNMICTTYIKKLEKLNSFDIFIFSTSFDKDINNIKKILSFLNLKKENKILWAGGTAFITDPLKIIDDVDFIFRGDIEDKFNLIIEHILKYKNNKVKLLKKLEDIKGIITKNKKDISIDNINIIKNLKNPAKSIFLTDNTEFKNTFLIEIARGCKFKCNFCFIGHIFPYRYYPLENILKEIEKIKGITNKIGLIASDVLSHPQFYILYEKLIKMNFKVSFSSFRADLITERFMELYSKNGNKSLTIAPEVASDKMRKIINKRISEEQILKIAEWIVKFKLKKIKLYFLVGLPEEEEEDVLQIYHLINKIHKIFLKNSKKLKYIPLIEVSINQFEPRLFTPFEKFQIVKKSLLRKKIKKLRSLLRQTGNIKLSIYFQK